MFSNRRYLYLVLTLMESSIPTNQDFLSFFVWFINCSSLICKLYILFWTVLILQNIYTTGSYRKCNSHCYPLFSYFLFVNKVYELNVIKLSNIYRHVQKLKHYLQLRPVKVFVYGKFISNYYVNS